MQHELKAQTSEKQAELDRLREQFESLAEVEAQQLALIERLSNNGT